MSPEETGSSSEGDSRSSSDSDSRSWSDSDCKGRNNRQIRGGILVYEGRLYNHATSNVAIYSHKTSQDKL